MGKVGALIIVGALVAVGLLTVTNVEPVSAGGGSTDWKQTDVGGVHSCGTTTARRLFCWGNDAQGQLGNGAPCCNSSLPVEVTGAAINWKQVDAGGTHTCAVKTTGRLWCWGDDGNGQLGDGEPFADSNVPVPVGTATNWKRVGLGGSHTCATKTSKRLFCWGDDIAGQLGDGAPNADTSTPTQVAGAARDWRRVVGGNAHTCATKTSGQLFCWGNDGQGQLGDGTIGGAAPSPAEVTGAATNWAKPTAGDLHTCVTKASDRLFCWGDDGAGQLGDGTSGADSPTPTEVSGAATNWSLVSAGQASTCARKRTERVFCWGSDAQGRLGNGAGGATDEPDEIAGAATDWKQVTVGATHGCARKANGRLFCWGNDTSGQTGDGMVAGGDVTSPQEVMAHP